MARVSHKKTANKETSEVLLLSEAFEAHDEGLVHLFESVKYMETSYGILKDTLTKYLTYKNKLQ